MFAILDTSVLVSGLRSKRGDSFQVIQAIRAGNLRVSVSVALVLEYESVLLRRRRNFYSVKVENYFWGRSAGFMLR